MSAILKRRDFLKKSTLTCMGACMLYAGKDVFASALQDDSVIDPEKLCYCSYSCPADCHLLEASVKNDPELKQAAYKEWGLEERYGLKFDAEKIFCFRCKPGDKPEGPVLTNCTVRSCVIEKGYQACIECDELGTCEKDLWTRFPQFHEAVQEMQVKYRAQG